MSKDALAKVVQRAISDAAFRRQLNSDPAGALRGFDLSADELSAVRTGDAGRLSTLGIDQRMSKAFAIGGALASTRMSQSDLTPGGGPSMVDDLSGAGGKTVIPADPAQVGSADATGGAGATGTAHAGDDWARSSAAIADSGRIGSARLDDASGASGGANAINDDPDGFLAANANADASGSVVRANVIHDDPDGFLAANANADTSGSVVRANVIHDDPDGFLAANANADATGGSAGDGTAFVDESEAYLTTGGYDPSVTSSAVTDAHDRVWSGDDIAGPTSVDADVDGGSGLSGAEGGPNITP